ncbi:MAG: metalloregulator ArsR/SmtB family transcription factor [Acidobacteriota bacterium]
MIVDEKFLDMYVLMCRTISKPDRLRIIDLVSDKKMNVSAIQKKMDISMSSLSNHLNDLYKVGVLSKEKDGKLVFYYLTDPNLITSIGEMHKVIKSIFNKRGK